MKFIKVNNKYLNAKLINSVYIVSHHYINNDGGKTYHHKLIVGSEYQDFKTEKEALEAMQKVLNELEIIE